MPNTLLKLINQNNFLTISRPIARALGIQTAIFLSELISKYEYFHGQGELTNLSGEEGLWFYLKIDDMEERTFLSRKIQSKCIGKLTELKIIKQTVRGVPAKRFFQIDEERLSEYLDKELSVEKTSMSKKDKLACAKRTNSLYIRDKKEIDKKKKGRFVPNPPTSASPSSPLVGSKDKKESPSRIRKASKEKIEVEPSVWLTEKERESLSKGFTPLEVKKAIMQYSVWKRSKGITRKSDYKSIVNWISKDREQAKGLPEDIRKEDEARLIETNKEWLRNKYKTMNPTFGLDVSGSSVDLLKNKEDGKYCILKSYSLESFSFTDEFEEFLKDMEGILYE